MSIFKLFPSKYLKPHDIEDGEIVTIKAVMVERVGVDQEEKPIVFFNEHDKGVILNKTNAEAIAKVFGEEEDDWPGKRLALVTVPSRTPQGEATTSIRMKPAPAKKKAAAKTATAVSDEDPDLADSEDPGNWDDEAA